MLYQKIQISHKNIILETIPLTQFKMAAPGGGFSFGASAPKPGGLFGSLG